MNRRAFLAMLAAPVMAPLVPCPAVAKALADRVTIKEVWLKVAGVWAHTWHDAEGNLIHREMVEDLPFVLCQSPILTLPEGM